MSTEIVFGIIAIIASLISATIVHTLDRNEDNKIDEEELKEAIMEILKKE